MELNELYLPRKGRSSAAGDLHKSLPAKGKLVLCDLCGPGVIGQIYVTHMNHSAEGSILAARGVVIRCFWDAEPTPSVAVPFGDFFGIGFGKDRRLDTAAWQRDGNWHMRCLFSMPFKRHARIEIENLTETALHGFYWCVEYDENVQLPDDLEYFHAHYRQSHPVPKNSIHTVVEAKGHGKYVGTVWSVNWLAAGCPPENAFSFFVDGQPAQGPNSEDYFGQSWGFRKAFQTFYLGQGFEQEKTDIGSTQMSSYRVHLPNPVLFQKSLRFTMDCQAYNGGYRTDSYDTVAFWYQSHPRQPLPPLPPVEELLPIQHPKSYWRGLWEIHSAQGRACPGEALARADALLRQYPDNPKTPDVMYKTATLHEQLGALPTALSIYRRLINEFPGSDAAADAADRLWLHQKPGRLLLTLVSPSGWTAYLDGQKVALPASLFKEIPHWGEKVHYRYGRGQCLRLGTKTAEAPPAGAPADAPVAIVSDPYASTVYEKAENRIQWTGSASSVMRLFTLRLEPGTGKHLLAVEATVSRDVPIALESQGPGSLLAVLEWSGGLLVSDGSWKVSATGGKDWHNPEAADASWEYATAYPRDSFGDAAWFWLHPRGMRKFPGQAQRIWGNDRLCGDRTLRFRKAFTMP